MELRHLRYFVAVAEELHFGRAAERLFISTPTLSQLIRQLEREIGTPLLVRHSRGVELTPAGHVFLDRARETVQAADRAVQETRQAAGLTAPRLRLGLLNGVPPAIPAALEGLARERFPQCEVSVAAGTTTEQLRMLAAGEVDLAVVRTPVTLPSGTAMEELATEELGVLVAATHPLAAHDEVGPDDLHGHELVWIRRSAAPEFYDDVLHRLGPGVRVGDVSMHHAQIPAALLVHRAAFSLGSRRAETSEVVWRPLRGRPLVVSYAGVWRTDSRHPVLRAMRVRSGLTLVRERVVVQ